MLTSLSAYTPTVPRTAAPPARPQTAGAPQGPTDRFVASGAAAPAEPAAPEVDTLPASYPRNGSLAERLAWFRGQAEGVPGHPESGLVAKLALAMGGEVTAPMPPPYSLLEQCFRYSRPGNEMLPALDEAARHPLATSFVDLVDTAESMVSTMSFRNDRPMETAWAALRLQLGLAECMGEVKPVVDNGVNGEGFLLSPLRNLREDAQSLTIAQCTLMSIKTGFDRIREVAARIDKTGSAGPDPSAPTIEKSEEFVVIGGVKVAIRR